MTDMHDYVDNVSHRSIEGVFIVNMAQLTLLPY